MPGVHRSDALMLGIARQFGAVAQRATETSALWFGVSAGTAVTSMPGANSRSRTGRAATS
jgi:hypothetical protein